MLARLQAVDLYRWTKRESPALSLVAKDPAREGTRPLFRLFEAIDPARDANLTLRLTQSGAQLFIRRDRRLFADKDVVLTVQEYKELLGVLFRAVLGVEIKAGRHYEGSILAIVWRDDKDTQQTWELRLSLLPSLESWNLSIRLIRSNSEVRDLQDIFRVPLACGWVEESSSEGSGLVLFSGPPGHGKTTAAYSFLNRIASSNRNIVTIEDPVEYRFWNAIQIQVNPTATFGFREAFRQVLHHDPEVIFVGEIRCQESAEVAIQAAISGHLVVSTIHSVTAFEAFTRLTSFGIEPDQIRAVFRLLVNQRLERSLCPDCCENLADAKLRAAINTARWAKISRKFQLKVANTLRTNNCDRCARTGELGVVLVAEFLQANDRLRQWFGRGNLSAPFPKFSKSDYISFQSYFAALAAESVISSSNQYLKRYSILTPEQQRL